MLGSGGGVKTPGAKKLLGEQECLGAISSIPPTMVCLNAWNIFTKQVKAFPNCSTE